MAILFMRYSNEYPEIGNEPDYAVTAPACEVLLDPAQAAELWSETAGSAYSIVEQVNERVSQVQAVSEVLDSMPSPVIPIADAVRFGAVTEGQACRFYRALSDILDNPDYARLALYFPFQLLPEPSWRPDDSDLQTAAVRFAASYRYAWYGLLGVRDVRANFVDGDVMEDAVESGDMERVVKAAHLAPQLVRAGMLSLDEVTALHNSVEEPVLRRSLDEALLGISYDDMKESAVSVEPQYPPAPISENRRKWLEQQRYEQSVSAAAKILAGRVLQNRLPIESVTDSPDVIIEAIYGAVETAAVKSDGSAAALLEQYKGLLFSLFDHDDPTVNERLGSVLRRLRRLNLLEATLLEDKGVYLSDPTGPPSKNLALMQNEITGIKRIIGSMEADPELSGFTYPVMLLGGSRLKGYGEPSSDVDVSVFIKPGTPDSAKQRIRQLLDAVGGIDGQHFEPIEYWLEQAGPGRLAVRDVPEPDLQTADRYWSHMLFGAAWIGDASAISQLQQELLPTYFHDTSASRYGHTERELYLERIEQDLLQYRLMHKGYARHYPTYKLNKTNSLEPTAAVDGASVFWDPGYRQLATGLFVRHVFLPEKPIM